MKDREKQKNMVDVTVVLSPGGEEVRTQVEKGTSLEALARRFNEALPFWVLAARLDNRLREMDHPIEESCRVVFLDMRDPSANMIYQNSLSFIYLKAVQDVLGEVSVDIENSLNGGLFTEIRGPAPVTAEDIKAVERRMRELVEADLPFVRGSMSREEAVKKLSRGNHEEKLAMLQFSQVEKVPIYSLDGVPNFFYGIMVPSTGYIRHFELRKYRNGVLLRFPNQKKPNEIPPYRDDVKLYRAFGEAKRWGDLMGISYVAELNKVVADGRYKQVIQISEALHEKKIAQIADVIGKRGARLVLIAGPSSSGKTTFARRLCIQLRVLGIESLYMSTDDYFVERSQTPLDENGEPNFEDIDALDLKLFNNNMNDLLAGREVDLPTFDFLEGKKLFGRRISRLEKGQTIVMEGIHGLNRQLTSHIEDKEKFKIYISPFTQLSIDNHNRIPTTDARMLRRIVRDHQFRGYSAQRTIGQWPKVRAGEDKNIFPYNGEADMLFNSVHIYELAVLKKYAEPLLAAIGPEQTEYGEAVRMLKFLRFFQTIEDDSIIVNNSIIREFIGGSIFVD
ncbi:MAG: nucleoside kinase [Bacillota bacterium]|nr:nucleoside kinase [Bacillota bacterium]